MYIIFLVTDFTTELYSDIGTILSSCSDVISAQIPEELKQIAIAIQSSGKAEEFSKQPPETVMKWLEDNCSSVYNLMTLFLERHGHRCIKEVDLERISSLEIYFKCKIFQGYIILNLSV